MKKQIYMASTTSSILCPFCGINQLDRSPQGMAHCGRCGRSISTEMLKTLMQIVTLPGAIGSHACECGHPEMRRLPDGVLWCPSCGSEVLPLSDSSIHSHSETTSEAYRCGWADGLFGSTASFVHNEGLSRWEDVHDRLEYYRGHRAGRAVRS